MEVYLDNAATTKPDARVIEAMMPYMTDIYANSSSAHTMGARARSGINKARIKLASLIGAAPDEIIFTSGATESNNMVFMNVIAPMLKERNFESRPHVITTAFEHPSVMNCCLRLKELGCDITFIKPDKDGRISPSDIEKAIKRSTCLISVMAANSETGTWQDITAIGALAKSKGILFHTDATQALGHISLDVRAMNIDFLSASAHKLYGPQGIGMLYLRKKSGVNALLLGGGQEKSLRSGTVPAALAAGFGKAAEIAESEMNTDNTKIAGLRDYFASEIASKIENTVRIGSAEYVLPGTLDISFTGIQGSSLLIQLDCADIACSTGSACASAGNDPYVLRSMGLSDEVIRGAVRFSLSKYTTKEEIDYTVSKLIPAVSLLRSL